MDVAVGSFLLFAASQVATPGPANMILLTTGANFGVSAALPFVCGVVLGKQLIIWPLGMGLLQFAQTAPFLFMVLKWICVLYILWLAWRVATARLGGRTGRGERPPSFGAGLMVHPLNPKAWAMVIAGLTSFTSPEASALAATAIIAACLFACQLCLHPVWTALGQGLAAAVAGKPAERYLMWGLAGLTLLSLGFALFWGGGA